jgi:hypothetical protein
VQQPVHADLSPAHSFWRPVRLAALPGPSTPLLDEALRGVEAALRERGHEWTTAPDDRTDAFVTTARLHEPLAWRDAPLFIGRKRYGLRVKPASYTFVHATEEQLADMVRRFEAALAARHATSADFEYPGLAPNGWRVLHEQGGRGGALKCIARLLQAQTKCLRVVLVVGDGAPTAAFVFDLAGAYPRVDAAMGREAFYGSIALRVVTQLSTREVTDHVVEGPPFSRAQWLQASAPAAMLRVSRELGARDFFTRMVRVADLVDVPALTGAVAQQYSEGCFGTWDPVLAAQVVTVTGSLHPVEKAGLDTDDLAVISGVRPDGCGVRVRHVEGLRNDPPSSEAVEFELIDRGLPRARPDASFGIAGTAPVVRSKLHGHRGIAAYDPATVEYVPLDPPFFDYLVSCSTEAQALGVTAAFSRSRALRDPDDPRPVVFTIMPGHGLLMVEKWVAGTRPFDVLLAAMDDGRLAVSREVPQGRMSYEAVGGRMVLRCDEGGSAALAAAARGSGRGVLARGGGRLGAARGTGEAAGR